MNSHKSTCASSLKCVFLLGDLKEDVSEKRRAFVVTFQVLGQGKIRGNKGRSVRSHSHEHPQLKLFNIFEPEFNFLVYLSKFIIDN